MTSLDVLTQTPGSQPNLSFDGDSFEQHDLAEPMAFNGQLQSLMTQEELAELLGDRDMYDYSAPAAFRIGEPDAVEGIGGNSEQLLLIHAKLRVGAAHAYTDPDEFVAVVNPARHTSMGLPGEDHGLHAGFWYIGQGKTPFGEAELDGQRIVTKALPMAHSFAVRLQDGHPMAELEDSTQRVRVITRTPQTV